MAEVRRYWSEPQEDLIVLSLHGSGIYATCGDGELFDSPISLSDAIKRLRELGYDPVFYDEFETWEEYDEYVTA